MARGTSIVKSLLFFVAFIAAGFFAGRRFHEQTFDTENALVKSYIDVYSAEKEFIEAGKHLKTLKQLQNDLEKTQSKFLALQIQLQSDVTNREKSRLNKIVEAKESRQREIMNMQMIEEGEIEEKISSPARTTDDLSTISATANVSLAKVD